MDGTTVDARAQQRINLVVRVLIGGTDPRVAEEHCRNLLHLPLTDIDFRHELLMPGGLQRIACVCQGTLTL